MSTRRGWRSPVAPWRPRSGTDGVRRFIPTTFRGALRSSTQLSKGVCRTHSRYRLRRHDGEYRWILESGIPLPGAEGSPAGYVGAIVDITERKRAQESVQRKEAELREAQRLAGIGSWYWDLGSGTVTWSQRALRLAGRDPSLPAVSYEQAPTALQFGELEPTEGCGRHEPSDRRTLRTPSGDDLRRWVPPMGDGAR